MEGILQVFGDMMGCEPLGHKESQESLQANHHQTPALSPQETISFNNPHQIPDAISSGVGILEPLDQPVMSPDNKDQSMNNCTSNIQCLNSRAGQTRVTVEKTEQIWQRIRWTDEMVKLLIMAVCYFSEATLSESPESESGHSLGPIKKGKWRSISNTMIERGYIVSPQQCEDKFNELNKKYKRLNNLLGRSISFDAVENPEIIESMNIPEEAKEEVRKILSCRHLFYQEMCLYQNRNRKFIPRDANLKKSVRSALKKDKVKYGSENVILAKRRKRGEDNGHEKGLFDLINVVPQDIEGQQELSRWIISYSLELEEKKLQLQGETLELEKKKFDWLRICDKEDGELLKMKMKNEVMRLQNERLAFDIKCRERGDVRD